jgi:hypothetical protein
MGDDMADYVITIPAGELNKAVKRDARKSNLTVDALLRAWLEPNLVESVARFQAALAAKLAAAVAAAADTDTVGSARATVTADPDMQ